jgi:DTW domain-containing protein YfiP
MRGRERLVGCTRCQLAGGLCVCALLPTPPLPTRTRLVLYLHRYEGRNPANTGRLAAACLAASEVRIAGRDEARAAPFVAPPDGRALLLYPAPDAVPLDRLPPTDQPTILVVPDGTWRQAERLRRLVPGLRALPCVTPPPGPRSNYRLRTELRPDGLATLEAIARAYAVLEGPAVAAALDRGFRAMVERTLWTRGAIEAGDVADGVPDGAVRAARPR